VISRKGYSLLKILAAFAIGGLVGAGVAVLVAPRSGRETRYLIREAGIKTIGEVDRTLEDIGWLVHKAATDTAQDLDELTWVLRYKETA